MKLRRSISLLQESPISDYSFMGSQEPDTLTKSTIALAKSPAAKEKAIRMFEKTPFVFRIIFWNQSAGNSAFSKDTDGKKTYHGDITGYDRNRYGYDWPDTKELQTLIKAYKNSNSEENFLARMGFGQGEPPFEPGERMELYRDGVLTGGTSVPTPDQMADRLARLQQQGYTAKHVMPSKQELTAYKNRFARYVRYKKFYQIASTSGTDRWSAMDKPTGIPATPNEITFVINSNDGSDFYPFTPWMIAHRFGHAIGGNATNNKMSSPINTMIQLFGSGIQALIFDVIAPAYKRHNPEGIPSTIPWEHGLLAKIGRFKSARDITFGDGGEFFLDCFAQYLIQGQVSFNAVPERIYSTKAARFVPRLAGVMRRTGQENDSDYVDLTPEERTIIDDGVAGIEDMLNDRFERVLQMCVGRVIVI